MYVHCNMLAACIIHYYKIEIGAAREKYLLHHLKGA